MATPNFGQTQLSATVLATAGTAVPVGTVVFTVDGAVQPAVALNGSAVAMLPSAISNALAVGSHTIAAVYSSSSVEFGTSNATRIFSVAQAIPPTVTISPSTTSLLCNRHIHTYPGWRVCGNVAVFLYQPATKRNLQFPAIYRDARRYRWPPDSRGYHTDRRQYRRTTPGKPSASAK